ncbi:hypothetical protein NHH03_00540 [Stieleria sp. TO1_6]|uniref:hypothetical protein n=1 Tax=Stieleria tagensis TaxID=2956795 RepID=UPI00209ACB5E|nr:hypothetical protein [Stieleria tagensis]MCO8120208.1 hypothetical protein [Stieleria tagensis]
MFRSVVCERAMVLIAMMIAVMIAALTQGTSGRVRAADDGGGQPIRLSEIQFQGNQTFSTTELRKALRGRTEFWIANHPKNDPDALPGTLVELLRRGYRNAGFRNVFLDVTRGDDGQGLQCLIDEGDRYRYGDLQIKHAVSVDRQRLTERLTKPFAKAGTFPSFISVAGETVTQWVTESGEPSDLVNPVWQQGEGVRFDSLERSHDGLVKQVKLALTEIGFPAAEINVSTEIDDDTQTVALIIDLIDEGEPSRIQSIVFESLTHNSEQAMLDYLQIASGEIYRQETQHRLTSLLWQSGRFSKSRVAYDAASGTLTVDVTESEALPTIDQPLDVVGSTLLRARQWLADCYRRGDDVQFEILVDDKWKVQATASLQGIVLQTQLKRDGDWVAGMQLLIDQKQLLISASGHTDKLLLRTRNLDGQVRISTLLGAAEDPERTYRFNFHGKLSSDREADEPQLVHQWIATPHDWLLFSTKQQLRHRLEDDSLQFWDQRHPDTRIRIDCDSGAIGECQGAMALRIGSDLFRQATQDVQQSTADKPDAYSLDHPVSSLVSYFLSGPVIQQVHDHLGSDQPPPIDHYRSLKKLVDQGLLALPDAVLASIINDQQEQSFSIPLDSVNLGSWQALLVDYGAKLVLQQASLVFPQEEWPIQIIREGCLVALKRGQFSGQVIAELAVDPDVGPIGNAAIAFLLDLIGQDAKRAFAARALEKLTPEAFQQDCATLLPATGHQSIQQTVASLSAIDRDELEGLLIRVKDGRLKGLLRIAHTYVTTDDSKRSGTLYQLCEPPLRSYLESLLR